MSKLSWSPVRESELTTMSESSSSVDTEATTVPDVEDGSNCFSSFNGGDHGGETMSNRWSESSDGGKSDGRDGGSVVSEVAPTKTRRRVVQRNKPDENACCLIDEYLGGRRCFRRAAVAYNNRLRKTVWYRKLKLKVDPNANHAEICSHHYKIIEKLRLRLHFDSEDDAEPEVDLGELTLKTLKRYKSHYRVPSDRGLNKARLAEVLTEHFSRIPVSEMEIITCFVYNVKSGDNEMNESADSGRSDEESEQG